ncbi:MAG TPA: metal ABC transporter permease [bacterium]|nr:metal ABC transporter permease [bacterium]
MAEFFTAILDPDFAFLRNALVVGFLASISFGIVGTYVVARRISSMAGAISHCVLGGIGAALFLREWMGWAWLDPVHGAIVAGLVSAVAIGLVSLHAKQREDTVIGALWAVGMAVGILFLSKTRAYVDPMSYLFGNILMISREDLWIVVVLDLVVICVSVFFYNRFLALCFDEEFAMLRGVKVKAYFLLLLCLTALAIVLLVRVVGIVLVIALLTLPAAVAGNLAKRLWQMMLLAIVLCMAFVVFGLALSYTWNLPAGATIIVVAGLVYLLFVVFQRFVRS